MKRFSVIIPTHGRSSNLMSAIASVEKSPEVEVIVVDDNPKGSCVKKEVRQVCEYFQYSNQIKLIDLEDNFGAAFARNRGAREASGDYLCFLDDDDTYSPRKFHAERSAIAKYQPDVIYSKAQNFGKDVNHNFPREKLLEMHVIRSICTTSSITISKRIFFENRGFNEDLKSSQEAELLLRLISNQKVSFAFIDEVLMIRSKSTHPTISSKTRSGANSYYSVREPYLNQVGFAARLFVLSTVLFHSIGIKKSIYRKLIHIIIYSPLLLAYITSKIYLRYHHVAK